MILVKGQQLGVAVCSQKSVPGNTAASIEFCLVWDLPKIHFWEKENHYWKYYTKFFGKEGNAPALSVYCLENYERWESEIEKWQAPILADPELPSWYKSALFNETYFVSDGGTVWLDVDEEETKILQRDDPRLVLIK